MGAGASVDTIVTNFIDERIDHITSASTLVSSTSAVDGIKLRPSLQYRFSSNGPAKCLKSTRSIRSMALMNYSKHENSYIQSREVISSTMTKTSSRRDSNSKNDVGLLLSKRFSLTETTGGNSASNVHKKSSQSSLSALSEPAYVPHAKPIDGFRKKMNLKINIQDDVDWIQVSDDEGGEEEQPTDTPRAGGVKTVPVRQKLSLCNTAQSYMFTQSGTILLDGLVGIGKDGLDDSLARKSSARAFKLPVDKRLVILCRLGHGASSVVYKALDLVKMKLVAVKMISVFERGKRRQMARELSALLQVLRQKKLELKSWNALDIMRNPKPPTGFDATPTPTKSRKDDDSSSNNNNRSAGPHSRPRKKSTGETAAYATTTTTTTNEFTLARIAIANSLLSGAALSPRAPPVASIADEKPPRTVTATEGSEKDNRINNSHGQTMLSSDIYSYYLRPAHEYIVEFFDAFSNIDDGGVALMMEYMDGGSLQEIVDAGGCDDEEVLANISIQALVGLAFLHNCSQIHRDLKPGNFLISHSGEVKVADLGILRQLDVDAAGDDAAAINAMTPTIVPHTPIVGGNKSSRGGAPTTVTVAAAATNNHGSSGSGDDANDPLSSRSQAATTSERLLQGDGDGDDGSTAAASTKPATIVNIIAEGDEQTLSMSANGSEKSSSSSSSKSPQTIPHTRTFVGTATYMSPERIDGREYSFPADIWAFGLSIMTLALGRMPIDTAGGYWSILQSIRDDAPPTLPDDGRFTAEFRDFLSCCLRPNPDDRLSCNQLLTHPFLQKASPEKIDYSDIGSIERGLLELRSILSAVYIHLEGIQALPAGETPHPYFSGLYSMDISVFMAAFLLGRNDITSLDQLKDADYEVATLPQQQTPSQTTTPGTPPPPSSVSAPTNRASNSNSNDSNTSPTTPSPASINITPSNDADADCNYEDKVINGAGIINGGSDDTSSTATSSRLVEIARQLYIPLPRAIQEAIQVCREFRVKEIEGSSPTLLTAATPKAYHNKR